MKKTYKALLLDLDGTTIPDNLLGMPSKNVKNAIAKARNKIHIGVATSRAYFATNHLITELRLSGPSIIHGGAQIIDTSTGRIYKEHRISQKEIHAIYAIAQRMSIPLFINEEKKMILASKKDINYEWLGALAINISEEKKANAFCYALATIPNVSAHKMASWTKGCFDVAITHAKATKHQATLEVAKILEIEPHEIIGVGDGYNDFPLLMASGLKVAMGNAVDELKEIADYVAPSVENDGVADIIEKFIL